MRKVKCIPDILYEDSYQSIEANLNYSMIRGLRISSTFEKQIIKS